MADCQVLRVCLLVLTAVTLIITFVFNGLAGAGKGPFNNNVGNLSDRYDLEVTPSGWTFSIWGFIYTYQAIFVLYSLANICRKSADGYLYYSPPYLPIALYVTYIINLVLNVVWLVVWDKEQLLTAAIVLDLMAYTLWFCVGVSMYSLYKYGGELVRQGRRSEIGIVIGIVHNGLGMYATWVSIATIINFCTVFTYYLENPLRQDLSSTVGLSTLMLELMVYAFIDLIIFEKSFRFLYTPYIVVITALTGIITKNIDNKNSSNFILACGLIIAAGLLFIFKIARSIYKEKRDPRFVVRETQPLIKPVH